MSELVESVIELVLLVIFAVLVHTEAPLRFVYEAGVLYLASVIRHKNAEVEHERLDKQTDGD